MGTPRAILVRHELGAHPLIRHYLERMNLRGILRDCLGATRTQALDHAEVIAVLVHNVLVARGPLYRVGDWARRIEPAALGLTGGQLEHLNDDRIARSLDALTSERGRSVFFRLALRVIKVFGIQTQRVHFDTTTVTLTGEYDTATAEPYITQGHNKDHRPDLKQLVLGLNVAADGAVPLLHQVLSGNRTDDVAHLPNLNELRRVLGTAAFIYVADSKLCTKTNLEHLVSYGGDFVTVLPHTRAEDRAFRDQLRAGEVTVRWRTLAASGPLADYASTTGGPPSTAEGYRVIWIRSAQKARLDAEVREGRLRHAELALHELGFKLGKRQLRTAVEIQARVHQILKEHQIARWLHVEIVTDTVVTHRRLRRGRPRAGDPRREVQTQQFRLEVTRATEKLQAEARTDGVFGLVTSLKRMPKREVLEIYKYQPYLEKRFALIKSEYSVTPVFLKKPRRVAALLHVYFIAIMLAALLERQVRTAMRRKKLATIPILPERRPTATPTAPRILDYLAGTAWHECHEGDRTINFPVEGPPKLALLLELADIPRELYQ